MKIDFSNTGSVLLIAFSSLLFFENFEHIAAKIFKTPERGIWDSITTYWTLITLTPIILIGSLSLKAYLDVTLIGFLHGLLSIFPFLMLWWIFFLIYKIGIKK